MALLLEPGVVRLTIAVRTAVIAHAREEAPNECCGLLIGSGRTIDEAVRAGNIDPRPRVRYLLDPAMHIATNRRLRGSGRAVVGFYHSHPASAAVPSAADIGEACYPGLLSLIVSLLGPDPDLAVYRVENGRAETLEWLEV
jgi:proteasome lid subunit RPN8/RPN11